MRCWAFIDFLRLIVSCFMMQCHSVCACMVVWVRVFREEDARGSVRLVEETFYFTVAVVFGVLERRMNGSRFGFIVFFLP